MLLLSYCVNLLVLVPLLAAFALIPERMDLVFGPDTDARRILVSVYLAIAIASVVGLVLMASGNATLAGQVGLTLFALQIVYKLLTVAMVGFHSPVVITNLVVVAVHSVTLWSLLRG